MSNCNEALSRLHLYIDRELSLEEMAVVRHHLEHCPPCLEVFRVEQNVLRFVSNCCRETVAPEALKARIERLCSSARSSHAPELTRPADQA